MTGILRLVSSQRHSGYIEKGQKVMNANTNECKYNTMRMDPVFSRLNVYRQQLNLGMKCRSFDDFGWLVVTHFLYLIAADS